VLHSGWVSPTSCLLDFYGTGEDNGDRGTDSPGGRLPNRTNGAPTSTPPKVFTGRMPFLPPNQPRQSTEGNRSDRIFGNIVYKSFKSRLSVNDCGFGSPACVSALTPLVESSGR